MKFAVSELHAIGEVQTTFHWDVTFSESPFSAAEALKIRMTSGDLPAGTHTPVNLVTHGYAFPGPGYIDRSATVTLTFFESVTADIIEQINKWYSQIYGCDTSDVNGRQEVAHDQIFGHVKMELLNKQDEVKQTYELYKVILVDAIGIGGTLSDGADAEYFKPTLTLKCAWYTWTK